MKRVDPFYVALAVAVAALVVVGVLTVHIGRKPCPTHVTVEQRNGHMKVRFPDDDDVGIYPRGCGVIVAVRVT